MDADDLTRELLVQVNTGSASGGAWLAPCRRLSCAAPDEKRADPTSALTLLQPLCDGDDARAVWRVLYDATELVMRGHFAAIYCGGCDCLENLAGQVLT